MISIIQCPFHTTEGPTWILIEKENKMKEKANKMNEAGILNIHQKSVFVDSFHWILMNFNMEKRMLNR